MVTESKFIHIIHRVFNNYGENPVDFLYISLNSEKSDRENIPKEEELSTFFVDKRWIMKIMMCKMWVNM